MGGTRNPNFSEMEIQILLDEVEKKRSIIFSKLTNIITNNKKARVWETICERVNSVNATQHVRTVEEIRKKFSTYTSETKKRIAQQRRKSSKTGGGTTPSLELTPLQEKVSGILGNTPIEGIDGGIETCEQGQRSGVPSSSKEVQSEIGEISSPIGCRAEKRPRICSKENGTYEERLLEIEAEKLSIKKQRLLIETERLDIEKQRLCITQQQLLIEQQRHQVYLVQRGVVFEACEESGKINK